MAFTQDEYDGVKAAIIAIATGTRAVRVKFRDREIEYQPADLGKLQSLLAVIAADLTVDAGDYQSYRLAATSKGV